MLSTPSSSVSGTTLSRFLECIYLLDQEEVRQKIYHALASHSEFSAEYRLQQPDGSQCWILALGRADYDDQGRALNFSGVAIDITKTQRLVDIMGGELEVESEPGKGSAFTICLPLEVAKFQDLEGNTSFIVSGIKEETSKHERPTVLLVEDHAPNVLVASTFLDQFGYEVEVAHNGLETLEKVKAGHFVAVLMDVQMHGMNGLEATRAIREKEKHMQLPRLPIIGMTAHAMAGDRERCIKAGMDDYISKPFNPEVLQDRLREHIKLTSAKHHSAY